MSGNIGNLREVGFSIYVSEEVIPGIRNRLSSPLLLSCGVAHLWSQPQIVYDDRAAVIRAQEGRGLAVVNRLPESVVFLVGEYRLCGFTCYFLDFS